MVHLRGDVGGAASAATDLLTCYPSDQRALKIALSLAALSGNDSIRQRASRMVQVGGLWRVSFICYVLSSVVVYVISDSFYIREKGGMLRTCPRFQGWDSF